MDWRLGRSSRRSSQIELDTAQPGGRGHTMRGPYLPLFDYLDGRFADSVVLTFAEIGDLLGFPLPDAACRSPEWWTRPDLDAAGPRYEDSWVLSHRTATPNLPAKIVVFDRVSLPPARK